MLDFFRNVAQSIPSESSPGTSQDGDVVPIEPMGSRDESSKRAGIIVLREDLDFYVIPPKVEIGQHEMLEVKRAAARALQQQDGIFSGLKRSDEPGTTEAHLIEMLTAGYVLFDVYLCNLLGVLTTSLVASTARTNGDTVQASLIRPLSAAWLLRASAAISAVTRWVATRWAWRRSCCFSGASRRGDAGGRASSLTTSRVSRASSRYGSEGCGRWR